MNYVLSSRKLIIGKVVLILLLLLGNFVCISSESVKSDIVLTSSDWKGFNRLDFEFENTNAFMVLPNNFTEGNPWIWRAHFPGWHTETDSILVAEGFVVAYVNTNNRFGSPGAMKVWDKFYTYLVQEQKLSKKVALFGVSRGGLYVYNWAKKNPEKVSCIYCEVPVCDFKSWPAGFGKGQASENDWANLKKEYGFKSDVEAKSYLDNPIDNLEQLAKQKTPILHMVGLKDRIVVEEENTFVLVDRYVKLGGPATIVPCTRGEQKANGHHFPIETPRLAADFIKYNTEFPKQLLSASDYHKMRGGLNNAFIKFEREKKGRVAFLGGSITYNGGWRNMICDYLQKRFPETEFEFIAAGIPSMGTTPAAFRLERDVLSKGTIDLLFEEAAVNDASNGRSNTEQVRAMEGIVRHVRTANPSCDVVLMHFVDPSKMDAYRLGKVPEVIQNHEKVADHYKVSSINLAKEVTDRIDAGEFTWEDDFKNLHPSPFGQKVYFNSMKVLLDNAWSGFVAADDKIMAYAQADKLDNNCYDKGVLLDISGAGTGKGWNVNTNWKPLDGKGTRQNYVNIPMLAAEAPGGICTFQFDGTAVGLAVAAGPDAGIIEYSIDGGKWHTQDLFTPWSLGLHLPWYYALATGLKSEAHSLKIRITENHNKQSVGTACRIRYFFVNK